MITTIPNTLVTMYHEEPLLYFGTDAGKAGVGADIAILDSGYYLSQVWYFHYDMSLLIALYRLAFPL